MSLSLPKGLEVSSLLSLESVEWGGETRGEMRSAWRRWGINVVSVGVGGLLALSKELVKNGLVPEASV